MKDIALKKIEQTNARKVLSCFEKLVKEIGFHRKGKSSWFARETETVFQFIHIHKYSFACHFRLHLGIRIPDDNYDSLHLKGPSTCATDGNFRISPYQNVRTHEVAIADCARELFNYVNRDGEDWFQLQTVEMLLKPNSCLDDGARDALRTALAENAAEKNITRSRELLGL